MARGDRHGLQWKHAPKDCGPHKTFYNRFICWLGVFDHIFAVLAGEGRKPDRIMVDATHLKAAASLLKKGFFSAASAAPRARLNSKLYAVCSDDALIPSSGQFASPPASPSTLLNE